MTTSPSASERDGETLSDERIAQLQSEFAGLSMLRGADFDDHDFSELFLDAAHVCELVAALRAQLADARAALEKIAALSDKPSDYAGWYDSFGDYADVDPSNAGDVHGHGNDMGRWEAAKIARAAVSAPTL